MSGDRHRAQAVVHSLLEKLAAGARPPTLDELPPVENQDQKAAYANFAAQLYAGLDGPPEARAHSPRGRLASLLWQRVAEWDDHADDPQADEDN